MFVISFTNFYNEEDSRYYLYIYQNRNEIILNTQIANFEYSNSKWWQVSFSKPVAISSYIIRTISGSDWRPKSWIINASFDNKTWELVDAQIGVETANNKTPFNLSTTVNCQRFRIIIKENWYNNNYFLFTFFDCFGGLGSYKNKICHTRYVSYLRYKLFIDILISSFSSSLITLTS